MPTSDSASGHDNTQNGSLWRLLSMRRFAPFFWTQFWGAFNDNVFKNALVILIAFQAAEQMAVNADVLINLAAGFFILPFFLFSATAGQLADKMEKALLIRRIKLCEIIIMGLAAIAFLTSSIWILLFLLFFMGTQSAFFGPVKYSLMPEHLDDTEIVAGNALVETGTFIAILMGTIFGGVLVQLEKGPLLTAVTVVAVALAGWIASRMIPAAPVHTPSLAIGWNLFAETFKMIGYARRERGVFLSILGTSWFWLLGAAYLTQLPNFIKTVIGGSESVVTLFLALFSIGIGTGSLLCERLSGKKVELGLVPLGSIGLSLFGMDLFWAGRFPATDVPLTLSAFLATPGSIRLMLDLTLIGISGGLYIVPLFAYIQTRTRPRERARVIAANNIVNAFFMVLAAVSGVLLIGMLGMSIPLFFLILALTNIAVAVYIYTVMPEFTLRFLGWLLTHVMYRFDHPPRVPVPEEGPAIVVSNHVSYVDSLLIMAAIRRPLRYVIYEPIYRSFPLNLLFRSAGAIPIGSARRDPESLRRSLALIAQALRDGEVICIFPEGRLTRDGNIGPFKKGIERIVTETPVPVIPIALKGLWGSFFSHKNSPAFTHLPRRFRSRVALAAGEPVSPGAVTAQGLREKVVELRGDDA